MFEVFVTISLIILLASIGSISRDNYFIKLKLNSIMATQDQFNEVLNRIDSATNNIAADLRSLKDTIEGQGLSAEVEAQVLARLENAATKLEEVAASTEDEVIDDGEGGEVD